MNTRLKELRNFYPDAKAHDWEFIDAGIRLLATNAEYGDAGIYQIGTEVVSHKGIKAYLHYWERFREGLLC